MKICVQPTFQEIEDPGLDEPLCIHQRTQVSGNQALVIFVHGLGGSRYGRKATWGYFPRFIYEDLPAVDVGMYRYRTLLSRLRFTRSIELGDEARVFADIVRDLATQKNPYQKIILVGHSMGGLLSKALVWRLIQSHEENILPKIRGLVLMATPQLGSLRVFRFAWRWTADSRALRPHGQLITEITETFANFVNPRVDQSVPGRTTLPIFCVLAASDQWVDRLSAGFDLPAVQQKNVIGVHTSIVKPKSKDADAYRFVLSKIDSCIQAPPPEAVATPALQIKPGPASGKYRVIAFDLDGTLLRGIEFSWTVVWNYLKFPDQVRKTGMLRYRRHEFTYKEWCEWACDQFRRQGLKREQFREIVKGINVTQNLKQAIDTLKGDGFLTAIISGGIDVFLEELIPDAPQLFDHIFVNKLKFDKNGVICGVDATPYDFEGKPVALDLICKQHGYELSDAVFVGEGFNDEYMLDKAGLTIAYPPTAQGFSTASAFEVKDDNLMKVVELVLAQS